MPEPIPDMSRRLVIVFALVALANLGNALYKGGDFQDFLDAGRRTLDRRPLYEGSGPGSGVIGPPAQGVLFAPFAALAGLSDTASRLAWYAVSLAALGLGVWGWTRAHHAVSDPQLERTSDAFWPFLAVLMPLQTNFEHQNMNPLLLGLTGLGALALARGRDSTAAWLFAGAAALKAFPALLVAYLLARGRWRVAGMATIFAAGLTALPMIWYGPAAAWQNWTDWVDLVMQRTWPIRDQNQSVAAWLARLTDPSTAELAIALIFGVTVVALALIARRMRAADAPSLAAELALVLGAAVLLSPIAWDHYWVLMFPAFLAVHSRRGPSRAAARTTFRVAAVLVSGVSPLTLGRQGFNVVRSWSNSTIAGLLLVGYLAWMLWRDGGRAPRLPRDARLS
jgi:hypothetical protein